MTTDRAFAALKRTVLSGLASDLAPLLSCLQKQEAPNSLNHQPAFGLVCSVELKGACCENTHGKCDASEATAAL